MTQFEQELIRAIEHGCPNCGEHDFQAKIAERSWFAIWVQDDKYIDREWVELADNSDDTYHAIVCANWLRCNAILWTSGDGWIPELQEVVKGE